MTVSITFSFAGKLDDGIFLLQGSAIATRSPLFPASWPFFMVQEDWDNMATWAADFVKQEAITALLTRSWERLEHQGRIDAAWKPTSRQLR